MILEATRRGSYWLIKEGGIEYLVTIPTLKVNDVNMGTVGELFECENYNPNYRNMTVAQPAISS